MAGYAHCILIWHQIFEHRLRMNLSYIELGLDFERLSLDLALKSVNAPRAQADQWQKRIDR